MGIGTLRQHHGRRPLSEPPRPAPPPFVSREELTRALEAQAREHAEALAELKAAHAAGVAVLRAEAEAARGAAPPDGEDRKAARSARAAGR